MTVKYVIFVLLTADKRTIDTAPGSPVDENRASPTVVALDS
jgi:hypothetical protein